MATGKGGARHLPKPFVDSGVLYQTLSQHKELVQNFGRYDTVSTNQGIDAAGLMQVLPLMHSLLKVEPTCEIHTQPLRQALMKMVMDDPSVNNSKFQGAIWCNLRQERLTCVMNHFRRLKNHAEMRKCASRLTAAEFLQLQNVVEKIREKTPGQKVEEPALPVRSLKKEMSDVSLDSEGYPKDLKTPEKSTLPKGEELSSPTLPKGDLLNKSTLAKGNATRRRLFRRKMGSRVLSMSSALDAGLEHAFGFKKKSKKRKHSKALAKGKAKALAKGKAKALAKGKAKALAKGKAKALAKGATSSGSKPPWWRLRITRSLKPPRAYITGSKEVGAKKLPLIVEVTGKRSEKYNQVINMIYKELQENHLTKEEAIQLRDELC